MTAFSLDARVTLDPGQPDADVIPAAPREGGAAADAWSARVSAGVSCGEHAALEALYRAWFERGVALARRLTRRDEATALDVVQEAMLRAVNAMPALRTRAALDAWMRAAVRSASIDRLRREARAAARARRHALAHSARVAGEAGAGAADASDLAAIEAALRELGAEDESMVRERYLLGRSLRETAERVGSTVGAVHGRLRRALVRLRARLTEWNDE